MKHSISTAIHYFNILFRYIVPHWQAIIKSNNGQKKKDKRTNNDLQNNTRKTKDRAALPGSLVGEAVPAPLIRSSMVFLTLCVWIREYY